MAGDDGGLACEDRGQHEESRSGFKVNPSVNQRRSGLRNGGRRAMKGQTEKEVGNLGQQSGGR